MARRTKEDAVATRNSLLDAAEQVFYQKGVSHASLNDIALAAGATRGAIYWHFKDKVDLFNAMMERVTLPLECANDGCAGNDRMAPLQRLRAVIDFVLRSLEKDPSVRRVFEIAESRNKAGSGFVPLKEELGKVIDRLDMLHQNSGSLTGVSTGFNKLDEMTAGLQRGDLVVIAGRPSMGKTTFALNIAENAAFGPAKAKVGVFSMEMSREQLFIRLLTSVARIDAHRLMTGAVGQRDYQGLSHAIGLLSDAKLFIDDTPGVGVLEMRAKSRRLSAEHGLDLLIVDYLQLMTGRGRFENRTLELAAISRGLKGLAKELGVPVVALSQLSRAPESRSDHRPLLSDLRESGALEQDADLVLMLFRADMYPDAKPEDQGKAELIINGVFDCMERALRGGDRIEIRGFGSFEIRHYKAYEGRNPRTGDPVGVQPKRLPFFKVGKELKERVNNGYLRELAEKGLPTGLPVAATGTRSLAGSKDILG